ncbi:MAG: nucleotide sugar dehydrogenase [Chloroflexi bacterium]|nr:nucleotide sugar dehydrogenase [Chloroflexota bacterium]
MEQSLENKIQDKSARIAIVGLGYVGLPLAVEFAKRGFSVTGIDTDRPRVEAINQGRSYILDVIEDELSPLVEQGRLGATADHKEAARADIVFLCVPTPLDRAKTPDLSFVTKAAQEVACHLHKDQLVVLQSTTYPGTTEEVVLPILEQTSGLSAGKDFYLAFSPERINPGDKEHTVTNTPKVVGGLTSRCARLASLLLGMLGTETHVVSSPRAAEMTKLLENIFRSVNIALVNELARLCERMKINLWEVIDAASTKPFGFMPFHPGPGVGGHCIPVDPLFLSWKAREFDFPTRFVDLASEVNESMPYHVVERVIAALNLQGKPLRGAKILVLGVAFKKDTDDPRSSPAAKIMTLLRASGAEISYHDPFVRQFRLDNGITFSSLSLTDERMVQADAALIVTGHSSIDYQRLVDKACLIVDTCNATQGTVGGGDRIFKIGAPWEGGY